MNGFTLTSKEIEDGWRLLGDDEKDLRGIEVPELREIEWWSTNMCNSMWLSGSYSGDVRQGIYRTKLSRAELRKKRGLEPEPSKREDEYPVGTITPEEFIPVIQHCQNIYEDIVLSWNRGAGTWVAQITLKGRKYRSDEKAELNIALHNAIHNFAEYQRKEALKQSALAKLSPEEREVLGFADPIHPMKTTGLNYGEVVRAVMADPDLGARRPGAAAYISREDCGTAWLSTEARGKEWLSAEDREATDWEIFDLYGPEP